MTDLRSEPHLEYLLVAEDGRAFEATDFASKPDVPVDKLGDRQGRSVLGGNPLARLNFDTQGREGARGIGLGAPDGSGDSAAVSLVVSPSIDGQLPLVVADSADGSAPTFGSLG